MAIATVSTPSYTVFAKSELTEIVDKLVRSAVTTKQFKRDLAEFRQANAATDNPQELREMLRVSLAAMDADYLADSKLTGREFQCTALYQFIKRTVADTAPKGADEGSGQKASKSDIEVPAEIAKLAAKLVAACNDYEQAKKLAALAVAEAFAAAK